MTSEANSVCRRRQNLSATDDGSTSLPRVLMIGPHAASDP
jgi:hypothetical protein